MGISEDVAKYINDFEYVAGETPLSSVQAPFIGLAIYLTVFFSLGKIYGTVGRKETDETKIAVAKARTQFYKPFMIAHNVFLSVGSLAMLLGLLHGYKQQVDVEPTPSSAFVRIVCDSGQTLFGKLQFWLWIFYLSKFYEFLDTVFLCLTMRRVIPLHWIHHVLTLLVAWTGLETKHTVMGLACVMNTFIHVIMYGYYAYKLINPSFVWSFKQHFTNLQMLQFVINLVGLGMWTYMDIFLEDDCTGEMWVIYVVLFVMVVFLGLFSSFAKSAYKTKAPSAKE